MATLRINGARNLLPGDYLLITDTVVTEVWHDAAGTWLETDDGERGYAHRENATYPVER